ncbi:MAG TPA: cation-transporting P-type ATPase [Candidatus Nanoarchaeia archaeon]|nr:cation-transporting P-type ATPase [Candidatus Nanoarchaeia archaeon]
MLKERGLAKKEVEKRLKQFGLNEIKDITKTTSLKIILRQIKNNFLVYLLFLAMLISFFVGKPVTAYTILGVICMVVIVGFVQEYRAERAVSALKRMLVPVSIVIRDGKEQEVQSINLVPGDILVLRNGEKIPADCILLEEHELRVNESVLSGESKEIRKKVGKTRKYIDENFIFMGTYIVNGRCRAKVLHTGMNTKFGKIAGLISTTEKELPLQRKVNNIVKYMVILASAISILTGAIIWLRSAVITTEIVIDILILVIALSVSAFPEGLPVVLITTLASGAHRMAKQNAIVNRMSIIETLGETTVICSDKTGTITKGEMTVKKIYADDSFFDVSGTGYEVKGEFLDQNNKVNLNKKPFFTALFNNLVLCNDARIERTGQDHEFRAIGSPTEAALLVLAAKAGLFREDLNFKRVQELPFNSERKMMSVLCQVNKDQIVYSKGAPEYLLKHCNFIQKKGKIIRLTERERKKVLKANSSMNLKSLRTLAFAYKIVNSVTKIHLEENLIFIGLVGMEDPPREGVKEALRQCKDAGIKVKMITGDNKETALAIAREIGLYGKLMGGDELESLTDDELAKIIISISIFFRVKPEHKLKIVKALKAKGEIVTMTGDGVNDAPALKEAQIGIAMGKNGTDVSRSVADLTLKDDNFNTIVLAISEGRAIFNNIQKFVTYQLSCNFAELAIIFVGALLAPFLGWQVPLLIALQILFMNLVTDNLPAITLGFNPSSKDIMKKKPRKEAGILNRNLMAILFFTGAILALLVLFSYYFAHNVLGESLEYSRTVALFSLICLEIASAFNFRSFRKGVLTRSVLINPYLFYASVISLFATLMIIYTPLSKVFETVPLRLNGFILAISVSLFLLIVFDLLKYINNRKKIFDLDQI